MPFDLYDRAPAEINATRAGWAVNALNTFGIETYNGRTFTETVVEQPEDNGDAYTMAQDLISNILHVAVQHKWDPEELIRRAVASFDHENAPGYEGD